MACEGFICIEQNTGAWGINSTALGAGASAGADGATSVGAGSQAGGLTSASLGQFAYANADNAVALGARAMVWANNAVAIGADSYADRENTVSVGNSWGMTRQIVNVADGTEANDAVNKQQLDAVDTRVTNVEGRVDTLETQIGDVSGVVAAKLDSVATAIGGGAAFDASGNMTAPSFSIRGSAYSNVGDTISAIDALLGNYDTRITQLEGNGGAAAARSRRAPATAWRSAAAAMPKMRRTPRSAPAPPSPRTTRLHWAQARSRTKRTPCRSAARATNAA